MKRLTHFITGFLLCFLPILAWGKESDDKVQIARPIVIEKGQTAGDVLCFGCSIQVRGNLNGDAAAIGGHIEVDGDVDWLRGHFPGRAPVPPASPHIPSQ